MKTLYLSDLDGTLLNKNAELSPVTAQKLGRLIAGGLAFSVATARTQMSALRILDGLCLNLPVILLNGVLIYDTAQKAYRKVHAIAPDTVRGILEILRENRVMGLLYALRNGELVTYYESAAEGPVRAFMTEREKKYGQRFVLTSFAEVSPDDVVYFTLLDVHGRLAPVRDALGALPGLHRDLYTDIYSEDLWYLECFSAAASKYNGAVYLKESLGFDRLVGFGDNLNDLPLFEACDVRVAVANARPEVRAAADCLCGANTEDGVARWLEENEALYTLLR